MLPARTKGKVCVCASRRQFQFRTGVNEDHGLATKVWTHDGRTSLNMICWWVNLCFCRLQEQQWAMKAVCGLSSPTSQRRIALTAILSSTTMQTTQRLEQTVDCLPTTQLMCTLCNSLSMHTIFCYIGCCLNFVHRLDDVSCGAGAVWH